MKSVAVLSAQAISQRVIRTLGALTRLRTVPAQERAQAPRGPGEGVVQETLDLARQTERLLSAVAQATRTDHQALLVLCPEWDVVALVQASGGAPLWRTKISASSPVVQWLRSQEIDLVLWTDLLVLPQFQSLSPQAREVFERIGTQAMIPMRVKGSLAAILLLGSTSSRMLNGRRELAAALEIAQMAAESIERARLYAIAQARIAELQAISEMKSEYILTISHQLKTPVSAVKASAEMLADFHSQSPALRQRLLRSIILGVDSLDRLGGTPPS